MVGIAYAYKKNIPKDINDMVGYRTKRSMRSQQAWDASNQYAANKLYLYGRLTVAVQVILFIVLGAEHGLLGTLTLFVLYLLVTMYQTERYLKQNFD